MNLVVKGPAIGKKAPLAGSCAEVEAAGECGRPFTVVRLVTGKRSPDELSAGSRHVGCVLTEAVVSFRRIFLLICVLVCPLVASTELRLRNGDRVSGRLISRVDGRIVFESPLLGRISVLEKDAVVVELHDGPSAQALVGLPDLPEGAPVASTKAPGPVPPGGKPPASVGGSPKTPSGQGESPTFASSPTANAAPSWKGKVELGYQQQSGRRDLVNLSARADVERTSGPNSIKASGRQLYGKQSDKVNSDRRDASVRWRREFGVRWFAQTLTSYTDDKVKLINWNVEQNAGMGYKFLNTKKHVLNGGLGVTAQQRDAPGFANDAIMLGEFFEDYTFKVNSRLTLTQDTNLLYSPDGRGVVTSSTLATNQSNPENYRIRFNSAVQGRVTERVSINLRYEFEFDSSIADPEARKDQRVTSSLGYAF